MPLPFPPLPDGEPMLTQQQFLDRLKQEPAFAEKMRAHYEAALALPLTEETAGIHQSAAAALQALKHHQGGWNAMQRLQEAIGLLDETEMDPDDMLARMKALTSEATDHLLDVQEPERTRLMSRVAKIRSMLEDFEKKLGGECPQG